MRLALSYRNEDYRAQAERWFADKGYEQPLLRASSTCTDRARFAEVADEVEAHFGEVHVLVNNAGVSVFGPTDEASYADYDWIMGVNFGGVVNGLVSFLPQDQGAKGRRHVVNVASMAAFLPGPQAGIYTASKFAVRGLTEMPALQPRAARHRLLAGVPGADPDQRLDQRAQAPRRLRRERLLPGRAGRARAVRHRVRGRHGPLRGRRRRSSPA